LNRFKEAAFNSRHKLQQRNSDTWDDQKDDGQNKKTVL